MMNELGTQHRMFFKHDDDPTLRTDCLHLLGINRFDEGGTPDYGIGEACYSYVDGSTYE